MDFLLILTYTAICVFIFKVFKVPLNKWTVPTAFLGGIVLIGTLLMVMNFNHPFSETARQYFATTPIIPEVRGRVIEVPVQANTPVKQGDVLFKIDPEPFMDEIRGIEGDLVAASKDLDRSKELLGKGAVSERVLDQSRAKVEELQAKLDNARFKVDQTVVKAPSDGFVTQLTLRPGMMALPLSMTPVMTFVHQEERLFTGWFRQNSLQRLAIGSAAEVTLDAIPGVIFSGEIAQVLPIIAEGQLKPGGDFISFDQERNPGRVAVTIRITDPDLDLRHLPGGLYGQAAVYTEHFPHIAVLRKVLLRMAGWMNYVFPLH
ncbi:MAG: HlyD family secretion protein [Chromatiaceae bacterium]